MVMAVGRSSRSPLSVGGGRSDRQRPDLVLAAATVGLSSFGLLAVHSATRGAAGDLSFTGRQAASLLVGLAIMTVLGRVSPRRLRDATPFVVAATAALLVIVLSPLGTEVRGTRGWLQVGGLSLQPAEPAKVALVVTLAALFTTKHRRDDGTRALMARFLMSLVVVTALSGLVLAGGETGSVLVYLSAALGVFVAADLPKRVIGLLLASALLGGALLLTSDLLEPYQRERLEAFVDLDADPLGAGYNQRQSLTAIGSGGVSGKGLFNGPQTQLRYLPEQQTDFIFAVVGEELGFLGASAVLLLQGLILHRVLQVAKTAADPFGSVACAGTFSFLAFQVAQNVAMNLRLLPVAGIPLPFVSYGGSSLVASFAAVGIVQSVARHRLGNRVAPELVYPGQGLYAVGAGARRARPSRLAPWRAR